MASEATLSIADGSTVIESIVMPGLVPGIHVFGPGRRASDVDGRDKPGHDGDDVLNCPSKG